ncbi:hypothetical protein EON65_35830 [archaeon]|nr:MAG: hypothetical protein EON65_35830 [archaeon]
MTMFLNIVVVFVLVAVAFVSAAEKKVVEAQQLNLPAAGRLQNKPSQSYIYSTEEIQTVHETKVRSD